MSPTFSISDLPERIASKIDPEPESGCWIWTGARIEGYGVVGWKRQHVRVHRLAFHLNDPTFPLVGRKDHRLPDLDHLCRNRACAKPEHLEVVPTRENSLRGLNGVLGNHRSRFVGVSWERSSRKWQVRIWSGGQKLYLGLFRDEVAAAIVYDNAAEALHGDRTNERLGLLDGYLDNDDDEATA